MVYCYGRRHGGAHRHPTIGRQNCEVVVDVLLDVVVVAELVREEASLVDEVEWETEAEVPAVVMRVEPEVAVPDVSKPADVPPEGVEEDPVMEPGREVGP